MEAKHKREKTEIFIYEDSSIDVLKLSGRAYNLLMRNNCRSIQDFMRLDKEKLILVRNLGLVTLREILEKQLEIKQFYNILPVDEDEKDYNEKFLDKEINQICSLEKIELYSNMVKILNKNNIKTLREFLETEEKTIRAFKYVSKTIKEEIIKKQIDIIKNNKTFLLKKIEKLVEKIPYENNKILLKDIFSKPNYEFLSSLKIETLGDFIENRQVLCKFNKYNLSEIFYFLNLYKNPVKDILYNELKNLFYKKDVEEYSRNFLIIKSRAQRLTFKDVAKIYNLTSETIRQIEIKVVKKFRNLYDKHCKYILKSCFWGDEIRDFLYDLSEVFVFLLKISGKTFYDWNYDFFILENDYERNWFLAYEEILGEILFEKSKEKKLDKLTFYNDYEKNLYLYSDYIKSCLYQKGFEVEKEVIFKLLKKHVLLVKEIVKNKK